MEWVVTTGRTIDEAKDKALDELGVDELEAEFEVVDEPEAGLFGRIRKEAKVRARVAPRQPRPKVERRDRNRRGKGRGGQRGGGRGGKRKQKASGEGEKGSSPASSGRDRSEKRKSGTNDRAEAGSKGTTTAGGGGREATGVASNESAGKDRRREPAAAPAGRVEPEKGSEMSTVNAQEQAEAAKDFLEGLLEEFGASGSVSTEEIDEEMVELRIEGDDLGLLIGPKGQTLNAIQELARTFVLRTLEGTHRGRIRVDVSGYRQKRREALERFTTQIAEEVRSSGVAKSLEPMHPADRKVVHDTANEIDGVSTISEGDEPRRRVVIVPDED